MSRSPNAWKPEQELTQPAGTTRCRLQSLRLLGMDIASLSVAIAALLVSGVSVWYGRHSTHSAARSAQAADRSATAAEKALAIETDRRHEQRRPHLTGAVTSPDGGRTYQLVVTLDSEDPPLSALDVAIRPGQGVTFQRDFSGVAPTAGSEADCLRAYAYNQANRPAGLQPGESISWWATVAKYQSTIKVDADCQAPDGEAWTVVIEAKVRPRIENTIAL